jgi:hypothetical protein
MKCPTLAWMSCHGERLANLTSDRDQLFSISPMLYTGEVALLHQRQHPGITQHGSHQPQPEVSGKGMVLSHCVPRPADQVAGTEVLWVDKARAGALDLNFSRSNDGSKNPTKIRPRRAGLAGQRCHDLVVRLKLRRKVMLRNRPRKPLSRPQKALNFDVEHDARMPILLSVTGDEWWA